MWWLSDRENLAIKESRKDWTLETRLLPNDQWECTITSEVGWGNYGTHNIEYHIDAMRLRAQRAITKEINQRQGQQLKSVPIEVSGSKGYGDGVVYAMVFRESI